MNSFDIMVILKTYECVLYEKVMQVDQLFKIFFVYNPSIYSPRAVIHFSKLKGQQHSKAEILLNSEFIDFDMCCI